MSYPYPHLSGDRNTHFPSKLTAKATTQGRFKTFANSARLLTVYLAAAVSSHAALPWDWSSSDIGNPGLAGSASWTGSTSIWSVSGGGADIWGTSDQFHYAHRSVKGDASISAYVQSVANTDTYAKGGLMMRSDTSSNSAYAAVVVTPSDGIRLQWRAVAGGGTEELLASGAIQTPVWLRLNREGSRFSAAYSYDGMHWLELGEAQTADLGNSYQTGLCVTAHNNGLLNTSNFSKVSIAYPNWSSVDVGSTGQVGVSEFDGTTLKVSGSGSDVWGSSDQFQLSSQEMVGDATVTTRIDGMSNTGTYAKSGVMIRESHDPSAAFAFAFMTPGMGIGFEQRSASGGSVASVATVSGVSTPCWLKLTREGDDFSAFYSTDGVNWSAIGSSQTIDMPQTTQTGIAVCANNNSALNDSSFSRVSVLPTGWSNDDIGNPAAGGSAVYNGLDWTASGGGSDIWNSADQFGYTSREYPGDVTLVTKIDSLHGSGAYAKAGLMIRNGTAANAGYAFVFATPDSVGFEGRGWDGATSISIGSASGVTSPRWLKLVRSGDSYSAYHSTDGESWTQIGSTYTAWLESDTRIGLAVNAYDSSGLNTARFRYFRYGPNGMYDPFIKQSGIHLKNNRGTGDIVPLRGTNLGGWLMYEAWFSGMDSSGLVDAISVYNTLTNRFGGTDRNQVYASYMFNFITTTDLDMMQAWGINCIRLPFWWLTLCETDGSWRPEAYTHLDWLVDEAWKRGMYTILDYHGVPGGAAPWPTSGDITGTYFDTPASHTLVGDTWKQVAEHFADHPGVAGYDMLNEPGGAWDDNAPDKGASALRSHQAFLYNAIRDGDANHTIFIGTWGPAGTRDYQWLVDPATMGWTNVAYKLHLYADGAASHDVPITAIHDVVGTGIGAFQTSQSNGWNLPTYVGEFAAGSTAEHYSYQRFHYSDQGMSWTNWLWKTISGKTSGVGADMGHLVPNTSGWFPTPNLVSDSLAAILSAYEQQRTQASTWVENPIAMEGLGLPQTVSDAYQTTPGTALYVASGDGVLQNDINPNTAAWGMDAALISGPSHGSLSIWPDGSFYYTPNSGFVGTDSFRYRADDDNVNSATIGTVTIQVK
ncbi:cellulase family glycosylhydrolase [Coraliomargarita parva]|uniref:cellulase family glycosylhydrolase n=1 Tax=Coraliomargarita parva TaxID=3014050 RepID=UPI0022B51090|nr:cellulase family glycosylhydrolase [Coraliomargarita parva]